MGRLPLLAKARQEDLLFNSGNNNWTIVRPYITYSENRFQLGIYEKEGWLNRALSGNDIIFSRDIGDCITTPIRHSIVLKDLMFIIVG